MVQGDEREVEIVCPVCKERVRATRAQAETGLIKCSRGHEIAVMGALSGDEPK